VSALASAHADSGNLLAQRQQWDEAARQFEQAARLLEQLTGRRPIGTPTLFGLPKDHQNLAETYQSLGVVAGQLDQSRKSLEWLTKATGVYDNMAAAGALNDKRRRLFKNLLMARAATYMGQNNMQAALVDIGRAIELAAPAERWEMRFQRAILLADAGRHDEAVTQARLLAADPDAPAEKLYPLALTCELAARETYGDVELAAVPKFLLMEVYLQVAIDILERAEAAGYFDHPAHLERLLGDRTPRLWSGHPRFEKLARRLRQR